jgi:NAD(P)H-dependent flavin oxidoreductase YrpB (nitropropane dioxygenase family)
LLVSHGIPADDRTRIGGTNLSGDTGEALLERRAAAPDQIDGQRARGPPAYMIEAGRSSGVPVAALVGAKEHALKQVQAGVDVIVAQGTEAGGHCGEVSTLCLVPEVLDALAAVGSTTPALAAGGIVTGRQMAACVAMAPPRLDRVGVADHRGGRDRPAHQAEVPRRQLRDTIRSAGRTGKPSRQLVSDWTDAWAPNEGGQKPLPLPLQSMLVEPVLRRVDKLASTGHEGAQALATYFVGQGWA